MNTITTTSLTSEQLGSLKDECLELVGQLTNARYDLIELENSLQKHGLKVASEPQETQLDYLVRVSLILSRAEFAKREREDEAFINKMLNDSHTSQRSPGNWIDRALRSLKSKFV